MVVVRLKVVVVKRVVVMMVMVDEGSKEVFDDVDNSVIMVLVITVSGILLFSFSARFT